MTPSELGYRECARCHVLRPLTQMVTMVSVRMTGELKTGQTVCADREICAKLDTSPPTGLDANGDAL